MIYLSYFSCVYLKQKCFFTQKGASMKKLIAIMFAVLFVMSAATAHADLYGVNIVDANPYGDNINLYQLFNRYFADQLGKDGFEAEYTSSNDLYNARSVDPNTDWITSGSQLVGAFKVAALGHTMSMLDSLGNVVASLIHADGTVNIGQEGGITDLSGQSVINIADGLNVNFQLDAFWGDNLVYSWSSNPSGNSDGMIHMLALDITDLYNEKYGTSNDSVFMFAWEDLHLTAANGGLPADWDYQDFVAIVTNVKGGTAEVTSTAPEPATLLILGFGALGAGFAARRRMTK